MVWVCCFGVLVFVLILLDVCWFWWFLNSVDLRFILRFYDLFSLIASIVF